MFLEDGNFCTNLDLQYCRATLENPVHRRDRAARQCEEARVRRGCLEEDWSSSPEIH